MIFFPQKKKSQTLPFSAFKAELHTPTRIYTQADFCPSSSSDFNLFICNCPDTFLLPFILIVSDCDSYLETGALGLIQKYFLKEKFFYAAFCNTTVVTYYKLMVLDHHNRDYHFPALPYRNVYFILPKKYLIKPHNQPRCINKC